MQKFRLFALGALAILAGCVSTAPSIAQSPPPATLPLTGNEKINCVQSGQTKTCTTGEIASTSGSGTVSSVGLALPSSTFDVTGSPVATSGTLTGSFKSQTANQVLASPNGSSGVPTFRSSVGADFGSQTAKTVLAAPSGSNGNPTFRQLGAPDVTYTSAGTGAAAQTVQSKVQQYVYVDDFGADPTCTSASQTAISNAITYAQSVGAVVRFRGCYRLTAGLVITGAVQLEGDAFGFQNGLSSYPTTIRCDLGVTICVQMGDGTVPWSQSMRNMTITRAAGTPGLTTVGLRVWANQVILENISLSAHGICLQLTEQNQAGFTAMIDKMFTGLCRSYHVDIDSWAEARFNQSRFGQNGPSAYGATAYVRIRGGIAMTAGGPNTIEFVNSQFNHGDGTNCPNYFIDFVQLGANGANIDNAGNGIMASHIECVSTAIFHSDNTYPYLNSWRLIGNVFNTPSTPFFALNSATGLVRWQMIGNEILVSGLTLTPAANVPLSYIYWAGGRQLGATTITAASGADNQMTISGVTHGGNVTISGPWNNLAGFGEQNTSGTINFSGATGNVALISGNTHAIYAQGGVPSISGCGTGAAVDGRSRDNAGGFTTGSGTVTTCTITFSQPYNSINFPVLAPTGAGYPTYSVGSNASSFTVTFGSNAANTSWLWNTVGR